MKRSKCPSADRILEIVDGSARPEEEAAFRDHRRSCPRCAAAAREFEEILALAGSAPVPDAPPGAEARIWRGIEAAMAQGGARRPAGAGMWNVRWARWRPFALAGASLAVLAMVLVRTAFLPGGREGADLRPPAEIAALLALMNGDEAQAAEVGDLPSDCNDLEQAMLDDSEGGYVLLESLSPEERSDMWQMLDREPSSGDERLESVSDSSGAAGP